MGEVLALDYRAPQAMAELDVVDVPAAGHDQAATLLRVTIPRSTPEARVSTEAMADYVLPSDEIDLPQHLAVEEYQRSLEAYRKLGVVALRNELHTPEGSIAKEALRRMWATSLAEILENDEEFRGFFEINDHYEYNVEDGRVMAAVGKPMLDLVRDGALKSRREATSDPRMVTQANRDTADVYNAERVDSIVAGAVAVNTRFVVSRSLGQAMADDPEFWKRKGYREGLAFGQLYYYDDAKLLAGTFSIDNVDDAVFDRVLGEFGVQTPDDRTSDYAVLDGVERTFNSRDQALAFVQTFRARCYQIQGDTRHRQSVNEFMNVRSGRIDTVFDALCVPLSESVVSQRKHDAIHTFASSLLEAGQNLKPEVVDQLHAICDSDAFTDDDGRLLAGLTLYAAAEELYGDASRLVRGDTSTNKESTILNYNSANGLVQYLAGRVRAGVEAGRSHGGSCAGVTDISKSEKKENDENDATPDNPQGAYGGRNQKEGDRLPRQIRCTKCRKYSPREKVVHIDPTKPDEGYWGCPHCRYKIDVCSGKVLHESSIDSKAPERLGVRIGTLATSKAPQTKAELRIV